MDDLYNAQDVILLREITENRFQLMYNKYGFNLRKGNSASTLNGCNECDLPKVLITLPKSNKIVEVFEKTRMGGFSCVNTSLSFDTKILLSNTNKVQATASIANGKITIIMSVTN